MRKQKPHAGIAQNGYPQRRAFGFLLNPVYGLVISCSQSYVGVGQGYISTAVIIGSATGGGGN